MWNTLGQAATVAQLAGADVGGLISMIIQAAVTAQQNKKECEQLARRVFTIGELLQHLQDPEVLRRPELRRPLAGLGDTLREAHELVVACQDRGAVYRLVLAWRQAERFRDVQSRIDSYLLLFPVISHLDITRRLDRIYNILLPANDTAGPSAPAAFSVPQIAAQDTPHQDAPRIDWKERYEVQEFTFKELAKATNNFAPDKKIGEGAFGSVYMGWLPDGRDVAIKQHGKISSQGWREFVAEVVLLPDFSHKHIVRLFGYCSQQLATVYEHLENRSLDLHLHDPSSPSPVTASWKMRIEILLGVSRAIQCLQSCAKPLIHRDVKPSNILLDACWAPRLTDFGLALEGPDRLDSIYGTYGYMAPEYARRGILNLTTDVYSFGVVMLEVLTGKRTYFFEGEREEKREACEQEEKREACEQEDRNECEEEEQKRDELKGKKERGECEEEGMTEEWDDVEEAEERPKLLATRYNTLAGFAVPLIEAGELWKVLDRRPAVKPTPRQLEAAELVARAAVRCVQLQPEDRPSISEVVGTLEAALELARCYG